MWFYENPLKICGNTLQIVIEATTLTTNVWKFASETEQLFQQIVQFIWIQFTPNQSTPADSRPQGLSGASLIQPVMWLIR